MDMDHKIHLSDNPNEFKEDNVNNYVDTDADPNTISVNNSINISNIYLKDLDPKFKNSIEEFIKTLNGHLVHFSFTEGQKKALESQIEEIARKIRDIPYNIKIQNEFSTDSVKLFDGNYDKPLLDEKDTLEINPDKDDQYYNNKGLSLYFSGNHLEAIECYDKALEINPQNADAYNNKGLSLYFSGNHMEAIECYDKALEINPQNADAYNNKGIILSVNGYNTEAIECYDKALEINPQNADAYYNKGLSLYYGGNHIEAIECYDKALEINPQNADANN